MPLEGKIQLLEADLGARFLRGTSSLAVYAIYRHAPGKLCSVIGFPYDIADGCLCLRPFSVDLSSGLPELEGHEVRLDIGRIEGYSTFAPLEAVS